MTRSDRGSDQQYYHRWKLSATLTQKTTPVLSIVTVYGNSGSKRVGGEVASFVHAGICILTTLNGHVGYV